MSQSTLPAIRACLFDMDGLLLNTEDLYTDCTNAVLRHYGKPDLPWNIKAQLQGRPGPEAGRILEEWAQLPIDRDVYMAQVKDMQLKLFPTCAPLAGVVELLNKLNNAKTNGEKTELALATSSHKGNYELKTGHMKDLFSVFPEDSKVLGDDPRIGAGRGKPAPDIYLLALKTINDRREKQGLDLIKPAECLVFEDSVPGAESGRRAGMQVVWCPHPGLLNEFKGREESVLAGSTGEFKGVAEGDGVIGVIGDGWGKFLPTLENFPYDSYGMKV